MKVIEAFFDGCCGPTNPGGYAGWGIVVKMDGRVLHRGSAYVGHGPLMSNNVSEARGAIAAMRWVMAAHLTGKFILKGDSLIVIRKLSRGRLACSGHGLYWPHMCEALGLVPLIDRQFENRVAFNWIPREENAEADELSQRAIPADGRTMVASTDLDHRLAYLLSKDEEGRQRRLF